MKRLSIPGPLFMVLIPVVFLGSCVLSTPAILYLGEKKQYHQVTTFDEAGLPVLARTPEGKYVVLHYGEPKGSEIVKTVAGLDVDRVNRDIREARGVRDDYPYFKMHRDAGGGGEVVLDLPSKKNEWVIRGYYSLKNEEIAPQRMLAYFGPGLAILSIPWSFAASVLGVGMFCLFFRSAKKSERTPKRTEGTVTPQAGA